MKEDPSLDPNWLFSDIMQELLEEYRCLPDESRSAAWLSESTTASSE